MAMAAVPYILTQTLTTTRNNYTGYVGFSFDTGANTPTITDLGRWKIAGNSLTHNLYLYKYFNGTSDPQIATVTVDLSTGSSGGYVYGTLGSPVALLASTRYYVISQEANAGDSWYETTTSIDSITGGVGIPYASCYTSTLGEFYVGTLGYVSYVPVNFKISTADVPYTRTPLLGPILAQ